jgi:hypothetical protein
MSDAQKKQNGTAGYNREEFYFYELNQDLINKQRRRPNNLDQSRVLLLPQGQSFKKAA